MKILVITFIFISTSLLSNDYLLNLHAKIVVDQKHSYSVNSYYNILKLDGSFTDNYGNYGNWNALASVELNGGKIKQHFFSAEITYQNETKIYAQGSRTSEEFKQGTGFFTITSSHSSLSELIGTECIFGISFFKKTSFTLTKCNISNEAIKKLNKISDIN